MKIRNLDDLAVFLKVVDCNGFSSAARALDLAPATVSKQIARLEQMLGTRLFDRNTRHLHITDEGLAIAKRVRSAMVYLDDATEIARQGTDTLSGVLRITAPVPLGTRYLAPLIATFRAHHPQLGFDLRLNDQLVDLYASDIDLAVRIGHLTDSGLASHPLSDSQRVLVASPDYLRRYGTPTHPRDLARHQCLLFTYQGLRQNHWTLKRSDRAAIIEEVQVIGELRSDNGDALRSWSIAGLGISLRETWDVAQELRSGALMRVLPEWAELEKPIHAVHVLRDPAPRRISVFTEFLIEQCRQAPWET